MQALVGQDRRFAEPVTGSVPPDPVGNGVLIVVVAGWIAMLGLILWHPIFVSHDSINNYGHVWYVGERVRHGHMIPFHMPVLGHGEAFAFPYGFVPWVTAALLYPLLGNWVVTLWLVLGTIGLIAATFWAFPELRRGWWAAATLANPALVIAAITGQLPFIWAAAMLLAGIACWRRRKYWPAAVLVGIGQATHPAIVLPIALLLVAGWWFWEPDRRALVRYYLVSLVVVVPAAWIVFASPVFVDSSAFVIVSNFIGTLVERGLVVLVPIVLILLQRSRYLRSWIPSALFTSLLALNLILVGPLDMRFAWGALHRRPDTELMTFIKSTKFVPGATYRILRAHDGKVGMYQLEQHGARLDSEFFPESIDRQSWRTAARYSAFLRTRRVDYLIIFANYDRRWHTNEHALLRRLARSGLGGCGTEQVGATQIATGQGFDVYQIQRAC